MKKTIVALSMLAVLFTSCKKDDKDEPVTPTKENLTGSYKMSASNIAGVNVFNNADASMNMYEACERDDIYKLNADLTYQIQDAGTQCSPASTYNDNWAFTNSTTVVIDGETWTIKSWNGTTLVLEQTSSGITWSETFVKQ